MWGFFKLTPSKIIILGFSEQIRVLFQLLERGRSLKPDTENHSSSKMQNALYSTIFGPNIRLNQTSFGNNLVGPIPIRDCSPATPKTRRHSVT